ncbi:molybdenum cofactor biosynthesis prote [Polychaeton citri CBS 116435]|uniref:GTP 3',8-cyclase n=1 Tax=Polychaeton citri CBS 116435 TaxID=1314669 RepID=A0A9P4UTG1_9PEZI|nr:molybdenum cofactor biosynthesis prote [Polychaeton citri CBS 116435]
MVGVARVRAGPFPRALPACFRPSFNQHSRHVATSTTSSVDRVEDRGILPQPTALESANRQDRRRDLRDAKPFSSFLTDTFNRQHDYLRISVTERCNLRCLYCMPEEGIQLSPNRDLLTTAEIHYLSALFVNQGVTKIRLTGGEPTVRKDIVPLMQRIGELRSNGLREIAITTNGISLYRKLDPMVEAGLTGVNISLDTLDPFQFQLMTRRQGFDAVMKSINRIMEMNKAGAGVKLKINCVVMRGLNEQQILDFVDKTRDEDIEVRFIEYMPFDGNKWSKKKMVPYTEMLEMIRTKYPTVERLRGHRNDTSKTYQIPGFAGRVGFITSMTHNFCGTCNRLRITGDGNLKVCLHGNAEVSLRDLLRNDNGGDPMDDEAFEAVRQIELDRRRQTTSFSLNSDEGWLSKERQLLDTIGAAVKRKKEKHAGIGELENMPNRPMILIALTAAIAGDIHTPTPGLTHVQSSGEAWMVDVGSKALTKRVAIACASVNFSNMQPFRAIRENTNKKGDVLGTARIAGIMAAKRTPDLIPLCHPIIISKCDVKVLLIEPGTRNAICDAQEHGSVAIEARVDCVGPTGVEMEALTAALVAALTVYDMCKAADKNMVLDRGMVVYKSGGKSGLFLRSEWVASQGGFEGLKARGLEAPAHKGR